MKCTSCNNSLQDIAKFCGGCGTEAPKNWATVIVVGIIAAIGWFWWRKLKEREDQ